MAPAFTTLANVSVQGQVLRLRGLEINCQSPEKEDSEGLTQTNTQSSLTSNAVVSVLMCGERTVWGPVWALCPWRQPGRQWVAPWAESQGRPDASSKKDSLPEAQTQVQAQLPLPPWLLLGVSGGCQLPSS